MINTNTTTKGDTMNNQNNINQSWELIELGVLNTAKKLDAKYLKPARLEVPVSNWDRVLNTNIITGRL